MYEYLEYGNVENIDDFYEKGEDNIIHVQDSNGYYIMYDTALKALK